MSGKEVGNAILAEIVGGSHSRHSSPALAGHSSLDDDANVRHGIAVFVSDTPGDDARCQHVKYEVIKRLASGDSDDVDIRAVAAAVHFGEACLFEEDAIATGDDVLDIEMSVGVGGGAVVGALLLVFGHDLHENFLDGMAAGFFDYGAGERAGVRGLGGGGRRRSAGSLSGDGDRQNAEAERHG